MNIHWNLLLFNKKEEKVSLKSITSRACKITFFYGFFKYFFVVIQHYKAYLLSFWIIKYLKIWQVVLFCEIYIEPFIMPWNIIEPHPNWVWRKIKSKDFRQFFSRISFSIWTKNEVIVSRQNFMKALYWNQIS